jgi:hypothetical protein
VRILVYQPQHQQADRARGAWPPRLFGPGSLGVSTGDQVAVPPKDGVRAHHQVQLCEPVPRQPVQQRREQGAIARGEAHPRGIELALQDAELVPEVTISISLSRSLIGSRRRSVNVFATPR